MMFAKALVLVQLVSMSSAIILRLHGDQSPFGAMCDSLLDVMPPEKFVTLDAFKEDPGQYMVIGGSDLPKQLQGIFWLANNSDGSALMSWGGPLASTANDGCSSGKIEKDGSYCIREAGDGSWAWATQNSWIYQVERECDRHLSYKFDNAHDPKHAEMSTRVGACPRNPAGCTTLIGAMNSNIAIDMELTDDCGVGRELKGSACWARRIWGKGIDGKPLPRPEQRSYTIIQIIDAKGKPIEPAWSAFAEVQRNPFLTGALPNTLVYHDWYPGANEKAIKTGAFAKDNKAEEVGQ